MTSLHHWDFSVPSHPCPWYPGCVPRYWRNLSASKRAVMLSSSSWSDKIYNSCINVSIQILTVNLKKNTCYFLQHISRQVHSVKTKRKDPTFFWHLFLGAPSWLTSRLYLAPFGCQNHHFFLFFSETLGPLGFHPLRVQVQNSHIPRRLSELVVHQILSIWNAPTHPATWGVLVMGWDGRRWTIFLNGILDWMDFFCLGISPLIMVRKFSDWIGCGLLFSIFFGWKNWREVSVFLGISPQKKWLMWENPP